MARIHRFYLLIAAMVMSKTYSASGAYISGDAPTTMVNIQQYCAASRNAGSSEAECAICVPYNAENGDELDDFLSEWHYNYITFNGTRLGDLDDMCAPAECVIDFSSYPVFVLGARSDTVDGYYWECTTSGWKWVKETENPDPDPTPACNDKIVYNGTFKKCCNPALSSGKWTCSSYSEKFCNSGYYGTFNGRSTDCTQCPPSSHQIAGSDGGNWFPTGKYVAVSSKHPGNTSQSACYILAGSVNMIDDSGVYIFTSNCGY